MTPRRSTVISAKLMEKRLPRGVGLRRNETSYELYLSASGEVVDAVPLDEVKKWKHPADVMAHRAQRATGRRAQGKKLYR